MTQFQKQEELFQQLQQVAAQRKACDSRLPEYMELLEKENALLKEYNSVPSDEDRLAQIETRLSILMRLNDADALTLDEGREVSALVQEKLEILKQLSLEGKVVRSTQNDLERDKSMTFWLNTLIILLLFALSGCFKRFGLYLFRPPVWEGGFYFSCQS